MVPALVLGGLCIVAGGLVAAVTAHAPSEKASWAAAYLVLVGGVAQIGLSLGHAAFSGRSSYRTARAHLAAWNGGNALVVAGTIAGLVALTYVGGVLLVAALALLAPALRPQAAPSTGTGRWLLRGYRLLVVLLLVSIPVGLVLALLRN